MKMQNQTTPPITEEDIWNVVCSVLQQRNTRNIALLPQTRINSELSIDSVEVLDIVMEIEEKFNITIPITALADVETMEELAKVVAVRVRGE
ncbi:MAG: acyl carrier protein [Rhodospirillales bacterium]|nr:acyl carrier protein [Rhodospirillales bacterium]